MQNRYIVLMMGFYYAPPRQQEGLDPDAGDFVFGGETAVITTLQSSISTLWA